MQQQRQQQQQEAIQLDGEISYNEALIEERDEGISHIQHSIDDIHQMTMVSQENQLSTSRDTWCQDLPSLHLSL